LTAAAGHLDGRKLITAVTAVQPEQLLPVLRNTALRRAKAMFGSDRKNQAIARLRDAHAKSDRDPSLPLE